MSSIQNAASTSSWPNDRLKLDVALTTETNTCIESKETKEGMEATQSDTAALLPNVTEVNVSSDVEVARMGYEKEYNDESSVPLGDNVSKDQVDTKVMLIGPHDEMNDLDTPVEGNTVASTSTGVEEYQPQSITDLCLVVFGMNDNDKSKTGNSILGNPKAFKEIKGPSFTTMDFSSCSSSRFNYNIHVIDSPALNNMKKDAECSITKELVNEQSNALPVIGLVLKPGRFSDEIKETLLPLPWDIICESTFIIVADCKDEQELDDYLSSNAHDADKQFLEFIDKFGGKENVCSIGNKESKEEDTQVLKILKKIEHLKKTSATDICAFMSKCIKVRRATENNEKQRRCCCKPICNTM